MIRLKHFITSKIKGRFDGDKDKQIKWQAVDQDEGRNWQLPTASFPSDDLNEAGPSELLNMTRNDLDENGEDDGNERAASDDEISIDSVNRNSFYRQSDSLNSVLSKWTVTDDGSQTNLGFSEVESSGASLASDGWTWHHTRSKSFIDKTRRFVRRSKERLSLIELNRSKGSEDGPRFLRLYNPAEMPSKRASMIDDPVSNQIVLPERPASAVFDPKLRSERNSLRTSCGYDEYIDWTWLDDAVADLEKQSKRQSRADAQCQTHSWENVEEEGDDGSVRDTSAGAACSSSSSQLVTAVESVSVGNAMQRKVADDAGPSVVVVVEPDASPTTTTTSGSALPSWLRASMRRVTHFNLDVPSIASDRPVSAPAATGRTLSPSPPPPPTPLPGADNADSLGYVSDSTDRQTSAGQRSNNGRAEGSSWEGRSPLGPWPHGLSSVLALLGCTLGLFNISRFAVLSVHFGGNFIVQFVILSFVLGIPLFAFHTALGQTLGAGPIDMWSISPVFQGIGIALLLAQALVGIYSVVGISWMFVYFRDSFITKQDTYRWAEPFKLYREDAGEIPGQFYNLTLGRLDETVPDYLNGVVLQRHGLASTSSTFVNLKFQLTFNLAVVWMIVFVSLSKGLRSYGKVVYVFSLVPVLGIFVLASKILGLTPMERGLFPQTDWNDFFFNTRSWISAATEVTLTWNLLGAAAMQVTSHNKSSKRLWRDVAVVSVITLFVLILAAFLANTCHQILCLKYSYIPSSFERMSSYTFIRPPGAPLPPNYATPLRNLPHASMVAGDRVGRPGAIHESGYQVVRLATELMPGMLALLGAELLSPFWAVLFYFTLILFGIAQQLAIWHCVITGVLAINAKALKSWETTITFFACAAGFVLGLPMTTELGVFVVYFLDYCVGGGWWVLAVTLAELCAVFMLRGRPYTGELISSALFGKKMTCLTYWAVPLLTFAWNVIMPVAVLGVCITVFRSGGYRDMWVWRNAGVRAGYWPHWARQIGVLLQLIPLLCIPVTALIQTYRYLSTGPPDILDRLTNLYRPSEDPTRTTQAISNATDGNSAVTSDSSTDLPPSEDPPPKYTPPPSYSTATGARIAKMLRQSFRRSFRRIQAALEPDPPRIVEQLPPPPDYSSVLVEMNQDTMTVPYTAEDVANVLRSSFRRTGPPPTINRSPTSLTNLSCFATSSSLEYFATAGPSVTSAPSSINTLTAMSPATTASSLNSP